jgi:hypothetical protein
VIYVAVSVGANPVAVAVGATLVAVRVGVNAFVGVGVGVEGVLVATWVGVEATFVGAGVEVELMVKDHQDVLLPLA